MAGAAPNILDRPPQVETSGALLVDEVSEYLAHVATGQQGGILPRPADTYPEAETAAQPEVVSREERVLLGVDYLLQRRLPDGSYLDSTLSAAHTSLLTATKEMAVPHAISTIYMERVAPGVYVSGDQTSVEIAESGYRYHHHPAARARVDVETEEAKYNALHLDWGRVSVCISPKMSEADAPREVAENEHLADDDAIRVTQLVTDQFGRTHMAMQAILVKDVPLDAWVSMLQDPNNIFKKSIPLANTASAKSVMQVFKELELPTESVAGGVKEIVRAVIPYITDSKARQLVEAQYQKYHSDQDEIHKKASSIADRWLAFDMEMAESLYTGYATPDIKHFISQFRDVWGPQTQQLLTAHELPDGNLYMTRALAVKIEEARIKTLWLKSAIANGNQAIIEQVDPRVAKEVMRSEARIQSMIEQGYHIREVLAVDNANNQSVGTQKVQGGGGCPGSITADIRAASARERKAEKTKDDSTEVADSRMLKKDKPAKEETLKCVTCPLCKKEGVDARIQYFKAKKRITCSKCHQFKEYDY